MKRLIALALAVASFSAFSACCRKACRCPNAALEGIWVADMPDMETMPAFWLGIDRDANARMRATMLWRWGVPLFPESISAIDGVFKFRLPLKGGPDRSKSRFRWFTVRRGAGDTLDVAIDEANYYGLESKPGARFTAKRRPPMGPKPDLSTIVYGEPVDLLADGLGGWKAMDEKNPFCWKFKNGVLSNVITNDAKGKVVYGANLMTKRSDFQDFKLSVDFRVPEKSNSGIYLKGIYEIQVCDSFGWCNDMRNAGALYGRLVPRVTAERRAGEWQHYDITLVNRHLTVVFNGQTIIDNQPVLGVTGGAMTTDESKPGPIYLQGDHSSADFRNVVLTPIVSVRSSACEPGFTRIFNGKDLDGWIGAKHLYYVENGELVFREGPKNFGNLFYNRPFTNFTARFSFKLVPNGNNGFAVRAGRECVDGGALVGGNKVMKDAAYNGMEIQVLDDTGDKKQHLKAWQYHGSIYGVTAARKGALRPVGEWNDEEVTVCGENVKVVLNGKTILSTSVKDLPTDGTTPDGKPHPGLHNPSGYIGFLGHTMPVRFRDIRVREL